MDRGVSCLCLTYGRTELLEVARATPEEIRRQVTEVVAAIAGDQPAPLRQGLATFLASLPATIRQVLTGMDLAADSLPAPSAP